jgi:hypothetical protein
VGIGLSGGPAQGIQHLFLESRHLRCPALPAAVRQVTSTACKVAKPRNNRSAVTDSPRFQQALQVGLAFPFIQSLSPTETLSSTASIAVPGGNGPR